MSQEKKEELIAAEKILELSPLVTYAWDSDEFPQMARSLYLALSASHRRINDLERRINDLEKFSRTSAWESWRLKLLRLAASQYQDYPIDPITDCGEQCWREAFDDGQTPEEALQEQRSYGD